MIRIPAIVADRLFDHARRDFPDECCGALLGRFGESGEIVLDDAVALSNGREAASRHNRFVITADDVRTAEADARRRALDLVGFYHSHPDHPAIPSDYDREHALPFYLYPIIAINGDGTAMLRCWTLKNDRTAFIERHFDIIDAPSTDPRMT